MNDGGIGESAFDAPGIIDKGVVLRVPHGVACVFHQGLCRAPADEELRFRTSARDKALQLFITHEALGESLEIPRADALDIHPNCLMVEGQTQTVS